MKNQLFLTLFLVFLFVQCAQESKIQSVEQWSLFQIDLKGPSNGNPYNEVELNAVFSNGKQSISVPGFYDGEGNYKIRFSPGEKGEWTYLTESNRKELSNKKGKFKCVDYCEGGFPCYPMRAVQTYIATGAPGGAPLPDILYTINPPIFLPKLDYEGDLNAEYKICFNDGDPSDLPAIRKRMGSRDYKAIYLEDLDEQATDTNGISIGRGYSSNSGDYNIAGIG